MGVQSPETPSRGPMSRKAGRRGGRRSGEGGWNGPFESVAVSNGSSSAIPPTAPRALVTLARSVVSPTPIASRTRNFGRVTPRCVLA